MFGIRPVRLKKRLARSRALVVAIPVIGFGQHQALRGFKAEAVHFSQRQQEAGEFLAALDDADSAACLIQLMVFEAGIGKAANLGFRALRLQQEEEEDPRSCRSKADRTEHLPAIGLDEVAGVFFQRVAEPGHRRSRRPMLSPPPLTREPPGADRERVGVVDPVKAVRLAGIAGQARGRSAYHDVDLLHLLRQVVDRQRHRRGRRVR